ncbi:MAG: CHASE4 domain-containing protein, partial [Roseibium sp.]
MKVVAEGSGGKIANAIIIPMIAVVVLAVACVCGLMIWSSQISDESAENSQRKLLNGALKLKFDQMARQQVGTVVWDQAYFNTVGDELDHAWLYSNIGHWLKSTYGFSRALIVDRALEPVFTYDEKLNRDWMTPGILNQISTAIARTRAHYITSFQRTPSGLYRFTQDQTNDGRVLAETGLVRMGAHVYFFSAAAITQEVHTITAVRRPPAVLVSFDRLDSEALAKIAKISGLADLRFTEHAGLLPRLATAELRSPKGVVIGNLQWRPNKPGTDMLGRVAPVLLILALAIVGLTIGVIDFTRQTTRRLASSQAQAVHTASHDSLSGLPNREQFSALLSEALRKTQDEAIGSAVVYIDLDRFKDINDTLGHAAG